MFDIQDQFGIALRMLHFNLRLTPYVTSAGLILLTNLMEFGNNSRSILHNLRPPAATSVVATKNTYRLF
jgi:hypothetical protein